MTGEHGGSGIAPALAYLGCADRLVPYMYHTVELHGEIQALRFLHWLQSGPEYRRHQVKELHVGRLVSVPTLADILEQCQALTLLEVRFDYYLRNDPEMNYLLDPLDGLINLTHMYISLATYSEYTTFPLLNFEVFCHLTHLHLSPKNFGIAWKGSPIGFAELPRLTHLSLPFSLLTAKQSCTQAMQAFLEKESTQIVILWFTRLEFAMVIKQALRNVGIGGRRVVLFYYWARKSYELEEGEFWGWAEKVVTWRKQNPGESF
jgi:hypothetical protein